MYYDKFFTATKDRGIAFYAVVNAQIALYKAELDAKEATKEDYDDLCKVLNFESKLKAEELHFLDRFL